MNTITRRAALTGSAATAVALAGSTLPADAGESPLVALIEAHRRAFAEVSRAGLEQDRCEERLTIRNPLVPLAVMPDGSALSGYMELATVGAPRVREEINRTHDQLRRVHCSRWSKKMVPDFAEAMTSAIDQSEARTIQALDDILAARDAEREASGFNDARRAYNEACDAEARARVELAAWRPRNAAEAAEKRAYMAGAEPFAGKWFSDDYDDLDALLERLSEPEAKI